MAARSSLLFIPVLIATACFGDEANPAKPECNAENEHKLWPEKNARHSGEPVEICVERRSKYKWEPVTVDISELRAKARGAASAPNQAATTHAAGGGKAGNTSTTSE